MLYSLWIYQTKLEEVRYLPISNGQIKMDKALREIMIKLLNSLVMMMMFQIYSTTMTKFSLTVQCQAKIRHKNEIINKSNNFSKIIFHE